MPEHLRALIFIFVIATISFALAQRFTKDIVPPHDFARRRNLWLALTALAFLTYSFWIYAAIATMLLLCFSRREANSLALFFSLLFVLPPATVAVPGFGIVNYLFTLNHARLLSLLILLPSAIGLLRTREAIPLGRPWPDKALAGYLILVMAANFRDTSFTDALRQGFYQLTDVCLPYYVGSRSLRSKQAFQHAMAGFVVAAMILALTGFFEFSRKWLLYTSVISALGLQMESLSAYIIRGDLLRATATAGHSITLGYLLSIAIAFYLFLKNDLQHTSHRLITALVLSFGLASALSRGPWLGTLALVAVFIATGRKSVTRLAIMAMGLLASLALAALLPGGQRIINLLPFIGETDKSNITYREQLLANGLTVVKRHPWFGSGNYLETPEMEAMRQGQGIIDLVNSYLAVALQSGLVGLSFFVGFFLLVLLGIRRGLKHVADKDKPMYRLGRSLAAALVGILIIIFAASSIGPIPIVYWTVAGIGVAYSALAVQEPRVDRFTITTTGDLNS